MQLARSPEPAPIAAAPAPPAPPENVVQLHGDGGSVQRTSGHSSESNEARSYAEDAQDDELDALAARLYDRIRLRLRSELRVDRERAGRITDLR